MSNPPNNEIVDSTQDLEQPQPVKTQEVKPMNEPPKEEASLSKGALLKKTRESQGLSLEAIHEATKIPLDALRAIEEGYTIRTLSSFYYRGFLKMYAQYLNMDLKEVLGEEFKQSAPKYIRPAAKEPSVDFEQVGQSLRRFFTKERQQLMLKGLGMVVGIFMAWKAVGFVVTHWPKPVKKEVVKKEELKVEKPKKVVTESKKSAPAKPVETKAAAAAVVEAPKTVSHTPSLTNISLTVRARKNSWLNVKADGHTVFQGPLNVGSVETWTADEKVEISGKNLNQLEFEFNGKMIGMLGRADRKAKTIIITKDGLKVVK